MKERLKMDDQNLKNKLLDMVAQFRDYDYHAYLFVNSAVTYTVGKFAKNNNSSRHVTGQELIDGSLEFAFNEYGAMAPHVFQYWGLLTGSDIGTIVYRLIAENILSASPEDRREDFDAPGNDLIKRLEDALAQRPQPPTTPEGITPLV